jgi:hypothetical protein
MRGRNKSTIKKNCSLETWTEEMLGFWYRVSELRYFCIWITSWIWEFLKMAYRFLGLSILDVFQKVTAAFGEWIWLLVKVSGNSQWAEFERKCYFHPVEGNRFYFRNVFEDSKHWTECNFRIILWIVRCCNSFFILSYVKSTASSKASSPYSAI